MLYKDVRFGGDVLRIEYSSREVWKRLVAFQGIPLLSLFYFLGLRSGLLSARSVTGLNVALAIGIVLYIVMMMLMINALRKPIIFSIDQFNVLRWRPVYKVFERNLNEGTRVSFSQDEVKIIPGIDNLPGSRMSGQTTTIKLPSGLKEIQSGELVISK